MSVSSTAQPDMIGSRIISNPACNATPDQNVTLGPSTLWMLELDNSAGSGDVWFKAADAVTASPGSTSPDFKWRVKIGQVVRVAIPKGADIQNGLTCWASTGGADTNVTNPPQAFGYQMVVG